MLPAWGAEVDQFTRRFDPPADSRAAINRRLNEMLRTAVDQANAPVTGGHAPDVRAESEARLYREMRKFFNNHTRSEFVRDLGERDTDHDGIERQRILKADSIFAGWKLTDGLLIGKRDADQSPLALAPLIRVGDVTFGTDKLEHLFERGWVLFEKKYRHGQGDRRILWSSRFKEKIIFGGNIFSTGVFSYADIVANFNGMRFWNAVLQQHDDILGKQENAGPYVVRHGDLWQVNPACPIDLEHYIDWAIDEGINCSRYATWRSTRKVRQALADLAERDPHHNYHCPMDAAKLAEVRAKYGTYSAKLLNHRGIGKRGFFFNR